MSTDRRAFLHRAVLGAASLGALPAALSASPAPAHGAVPVGRDVPDLTLADPAWDVSWTKKVSGKHKALFDVPEISGGAGVFRAGLWARQYADVFKLPLSDLSSVIVIRHDAIGLAMSQTFWDEYKVGKRNKVRDGDGNKTTRNPVLAVLEPGKEPKGFEVHMLEQQIARGVIVLACNMAFSDCVAAVMQQDKLQQPEARAKAISMLVPGVILQPSGIFGVVLAQQTGCVFVAAA